MTKNILNLKKDEPVQIIEKIIVKNESIFSKSIRTLLAIFIAFVMVWGISKAEGTIDAIINIDSNKSEEFSVVGLVTNISSSTVELANLRGLDGISEMFFYITISQRVETDTYDTLELKDIQIGDKIIIQGEKTGENYFSHRIVSFSDRFPDTEGSQKVIEPDILLVTEVVPDIATSTDDIPTSFDGVATTTPGLIVEESTEIATTSLDSLIVDVSTSSTTSEDLKVTDVIYTEEIDSVINGEKPSDDISDLNFVDELETPKDVLQDETLTDEPVLSGGGSELISSESNIETEE